ncbi:MAG TPA: hypothetical protein VFK47_15180, partial [Ktedonobacteraceae bacterium]|nr:hypothetical protein [Ktedonobacteraceae bacterium]
MILFDNEEPPLEVVVRNDAPRKRFEAQEIWPFVDKVTGLPVEQPDFEDYALWLKEIEWRQQLMNGLNWPRSFEPRPYQIEGALKLRMNLNLNLDKERILLPTDAPTYPPRSTGLDYDQPGLGKTLQAAMALTTPAIITCPGYLVEQWADFLNDQYPQWRVKAITQLMDRYRRQSLLDDPETDIWVVNHEMWTARREPWKGGPEPRPFLKNGNLNPD